MTIEEIRNDRELLEMKIFAMLKDFQNKTGLAIIGCEIDTLAHRILGLPTPETLLLSVHLKVQSI